MNVGNKFKYGKGHIVYQVIKKTPWNDVYEGIKAIGDNDKYLDLIVPINVTLPYGALVPVTNNK